MIKKRINKKALSPLVATMLLVVFALVIGSIVMSFGESYIQKIEEMPKTKTVESAVIISIKDIDTPLKELQIQYITGKLTKKEYLEKEKGLIID